MATELKQRDIIDLAALQATLDTRLGEEVPTKEARRALFLMVKDALADGRAEVRRRFEEEGATGEATVRANAFLTDQLLRLALDVTTARIYPTANPTQAERICAAAVGGYGRGEMAPFSDIDLLFLLPYKVTPRIEQIIESVLYLLWDLGLKVGHATRSVDECIRLSREDITIRTSVLEARLIWGDTGTFEELRYRFREELAKGSGSEFAEAKLAERDERHQRMGGSRYVLEPNIKDGKGGLRDLQTLFWIAKYLYAVDDVDELIEKHVLTAREALNFSRAQNFLWTVRCHLHYLAGRGEERLTFDQQAEIGERLGYKDHAGTRGVERFMKHYYLTAKEVGDLTRIFCAALEAEHRRTPRMSMLRRGLFRREADGFPIERGRLTVESGAVFVGEPLRIIQLFHTAQMNDLDIHPKALRLITRHLRRVDRLREDVDANRLFIEMLTATKGAEISLRRLNEAGVLGRFVPDFGRVVAQMQHDMYHVYTVDEHTIFAIGILHRIERGEFIDSMPAISEAMAHVASRRALFVALLLHDIAKGRGGDHSELGAEVAERLGPRFGLTDEEVETVSWLVRHHLAMSHTAFHRDLNDPATIADFTEAVQSLERLRLLLVITVADIRAVGPNVWNNWKAALIRDLYLATEARLSGGHEVRGREIRIEAAKDAVRDRLDSWPESDIDAMLERGYPPFWLGFDTDAHVRYIELMHAAEAAGDPLTIKTRTETQRDVTEVTVYAGDVAGLFSDIAGAIALAGATIFEANIFTMTNGMALDVFRVQDQSGGPFDQQGQIARLTKRIGEALSGRVRPARELAKKPAIPTRTRVFTVAPRVMISNSASRTHSVIEINGRDRPGLLHDVTRALTDVGLQISSALITTYGERAVDVFYVKDAFGMQVTHEGKLAQVRRALETALLDPTKREAVTEAPARRAAG
ncbi:MAG: [protein-PII] uridylyltransferase [Alphaproteobacteria bacterium]